MKTTKAKPIAVATGDVHFTVSTLALATSAVQQAIALAKQLEVPLVLNGDTLDSKAIIRGECANRLIELLEPLPQEQIIINTGNHDYLSEKAQESSLNFLRPYAQVVSVPTFFKSLRAWVVPYFADSAKLQAFLDTIPAGACLFLHQGVLGADMGHYVKDSSSLPREAFADFRVIASHYHKRQDIKCGRPRAGALGLFSYLGSPYSITFAEAHDGPKGINIVYDDGTLELVPTNLRKHVKIDTDLEGLQIYIDTGDRPAPGDLLWLKISGPYSELQNLNKRSIAERLGLTHANFKLDRIATEADKLEKSQEKLTDLQVYDKLVDQMDEAPPQKKCLKELAKELLT